MLHIFALESAGTMVVLFTVHEIFRDIFHPTRTGTLSDAIGRGASLLLRHTRFRYALGPFALVMVLVVWVLLLCIGFAMIYLGLYPDHFASTVGDGTPN